MHDDIAKRLVLAVQQMADAQTAQAEAYTAAMEMLTGLITPEGIKGLLTTVKGIVEELEDQEPGVDAARYWPDEAIPVVSEVTFEDDNGQVTITANMSDGSEIVIGSYFSDELSFTEDDFLGKTPAECEAVRMAKDIAYLQS